MKKHLINRKLSAGNISAGKVILFVVAGIIVLPLLVAGIGIGSFAIHCNNKMTGINNQASQISKKLDTMAISTTQQVASANGDCITGSGTSFSFNIHKKYASPFEAKNDISQSLKNVNVLTLKPTQEPKHVFARNGSISGGNTPIKEIELVYTVNKQDSLRFEFTLEKPIPCEVASDNRIICEGEDKDVLIERLVTSQPVSSTKVSGTVRIE